MTLRGGLAAGTVLALLVGTLGIVTWQTLIRPPVKESPAKPIAPAQVKPLPEDQFNVVQLTPEAVQRLGIRTAPIQRQPMKRTRLFGGDVLIPPGHTILVAAPLAGMLKAPPGGVPEPGRTVKKGQPIFLLLPLLTPEARTTLAASQVEAEGQVKNAMTQVDAATIALERARRLHREDAGSKRGVDEAQAQFDLATKTLEGARARRDLLSRALGDAEKGTTAPFTIDAPDDGVLRNENATPEQTVPSGAALFEVVSLDPLHVRVPVYVGDVDEVDLKETARIGNLTGKPGASTRPGKPVVAPPSANALAATVDLFYEVDNKDRLLRPGQRVGVTLPLRGEQESSTVPWSAVVHDIQGSTWVYESTTPKSFVRRRVQVRLVLDGVAVLASGPAPGTQIVTEGAAELFGTEVGFAK